MIEVIDLWKSFGDNHVLKGINLTIPDGTTSIADVAPLVRRRLGLCS